MIVPNSAEKYMILCRLFFNYRYLHSPMNYQNVLPPNLFSLKIAYWTPWDFRYGWSTSHNIITVLIFSNCTIFNDDFFFRKVDIVKSPRRFRTHDFQLSLLFNQLRYVHQKCIMINRINCIEVLKGVDFIDYYIF